MIGLLAVSAFALKYGLAPHPLTWQFLELARSWSDPGAAAGIPSGTFILSSAWTAILAGALGLSSPGAYTTFSFTLTIAALLVAYAMPRVRRDTELPLLLTAVLAAGALPAVLLTWIGGYDALSVLALVVAVLSQRRVPSVAAWFVLGLNQLPLALVALFVWEVTRRAPEQTVRARIRDAGVSLSAVAAGGIVSWFAVRQWGGAISRLEWFQSFGWEALARLALSVWPYVLWSAWGVGWILLTVLWARGSTARRVTVVSVLMALLLPLLLFDQTRIVSQALLPAAIALVLARPEVPRRVLVAVIASAIVLPTVVVQSDTVRLIGWGLDVHLPLLS